MSVVSICLCLPYYLILENINFYSIVVMFVIMVVIISVIMFVIISRMSFHFLVDLKDFIFQKVEWENRYF